MRAVSRQFACWRLFVCGLSAAGQAEKPNSGSWSGVIMNNNCSAEEAFAEAAKCTEKEVPGAKLILYDDTTRQMFILDPQDQAMGHLGDSMTATGTLEGDTIHLTSLSYTLHWTRSWSKGPCSLGPRPVWPAAISGDVERTQGNCCPFFRSAIGDPMQRAAGRAAKRKARFEKQGITVAAISYDSVEILKSFADRRKIEFQCSPTLIRNYTGLRGPEHRGYGTDKGMARPGYFFIDTTGTFGKSSSKQVSATIFRNNVIGKLFPELGDEVTDKVQAPHLSLTG